MDIRQFIKETLFQIASGINDANEALAGTNAQVNPKNVYPAESKYAHVYGHIQTERPMNRAVHLVEFDVAVHATEGTETKGGIGIAVATLALGSQGKSEATKASESRIQFGIPMMFPEPKK